jgi:hypothetical protein
MAGQDERGATPQDGAADRETQSRKDPESQPTAVEERPVAEHPPDDRVTAFMRWARRNRVIAALIIFGTIIASVGGVTQALTGDSILDLVGKAAGPGPTSSVTTTVTTIGFTEADLDREANPRFGFSFMYPKEWSRRDPDNSDGNAYIAPRDDGRTLEMAAWGSYAVVEPTLEEWVAQTTSEINGRPDARIRAPSDLFSTYEPLFNRLVAELRVLHASA